MGRVGPATGIIAQELCLERAFDTVPMHGLYRRCALVMINERRTHLAAQARQARGAGSGCPVERAGAKGAPVLLGEIFARHENHVVIHIFRHHEPARTRIAVFAKIASHEQKLP